MLSKHLPKSSHRRTCSSLHMKFQHSTQGCWDIPWTCPTGKGCHIFLMRRRSQLHSSMNHLARPRKTGAAVFRQLQTRLCHKLCKRSNPNPQGIPCFFQWGRARHRNAWRRQMISRRRKCCSGRRVSMGSKSGLRGTLLTSHWVRLRGNVSLKSSRTRIVQCH